MMSTHRGKGQYLEGKVVSDKMQKTVVVEVSRRVRHPMYHKIMTKRKKFLAHLPESIQCRVGDRVRLISSRPISKMKKWRVLELVRETN